MKRLIHFLPAAALLFCLSACTSYDYYTAAINKTNLSSYHTFAWMPPMNSSNQKGATNMAADTKIKDAAITALVSKGLTLSQRNPDLVVSYTEKIGTGSRTDYYSPYYGGGFYGGWGGGFGWGGWGGFGWGGGWGWGYRPYYYLGGPFSYYGGVTYAEKERYKEGTLIIDLIDTRTRRIVWRGFGVGEVHHDPQKTIDDLPKVVNGVLSQLQVNAGPVRRS